LVESGPALLPGVIGIAPGVIGVVPAVESNLITPVTPLVTPASPAVQPQIVSGAIAPAAAAAPAVSQVLGAQAAGPQAVLAAALPQTGNGGPESGSGLGWLIFVGIALLAGGGATFAASRSRLFS